MTNDEIADHVHGMDLELRLLAREVVARLRGIGHDRADKPMPASVMVLDFQHRLRAEVEQITPPAG